ncbi:MAG: MotA/TolQ/ExbB proton channel family protein [Phycisphaera sp.]|nr:MAG: MotA/TolQ/ExbB proton channel family protein [Phycisphaera sp.]
MGETIRQAGELFSAAGWVAWPLAALSMVSFALCLERLLYFSRVRRNLSADRIRKVADALRSSNESALARQAGAGLLGQFVSAILDNSSRGRIAESAVLAGAETVRPGLERYLPFLSTTITAAPMLGILGTVTGIIKSFGLLGNAEQVTDPAAMAVGISEALYTTAFGLVIALIVLFPYNYFRRSADRALGVLETIGAAALESDTSQS